MTAIDLERGEIEASDIAPREISTKDLHAKIKQKWEKIHFYSKDGQLIKVKTYPYPGISKRTEEFHLDNGKLVLAMIEDDATWGKGKEVLDKMYYFDNDRLIKELHMNEQQEYGIHSSDAEELRSEVFEYAAIHQGQPK